jgi:hypothetical protein
MNSCDKQRAARRPGAWLEQHEKPMQRLETNLAEAGERLNALISVVDDLVRREGGQKQ